MTTPKPSPSGSAAIQQGWCRICWRVGQKKGWPSSRLDALIGSTGTLHHQKEDGSESTVCGLDATRPGWSWPE